jgi:hypothetical protein
MLGEHIPRSFAQVLGKNGTGTPSPSFQFKHDGGTMVGGRGQRQNVAERGSAQGRMQVNESQPMGKPRQESTDSPQPSTLTTFQCPRGDGTITIANWTST